MTLIVGELIELALVIVDNLLVMAMSCHLAVNDERHDVAISGQEPSIDPKPKKTKNSKMNTSILQ